ncbi:AsmA-like C-terminal region-containing protein [Arachidicoccus sp.]|uniref:AsmA family protein n=1 Tax=Arachidicoccus sp. TaxID=1872624 RepID=UPI003D1D9C9C
MASWYIHAHKSELLQKISAEVSENVDGNFHIDDMNVVLLRGFPNVAVELKGVTLTDSSYSVYHRKLLNVRSIFIKINIVSLLTQSPRILKVTLAGGYFHLFTLANGYTNAYLLKPKNKFKKNNQKSHLDFEDFSIDNVAFLFEQVPRHKKIQFLLQHIDGDLHSDLENMYIDANAKIHVNELGFNLKKGGYLVDKEVHADFHFTFNKRTKVLRLKQQPININGGKFITDAVFYFAEKPIKYVINLKINRIGFKEGVSYLTPTIQYTLRKFDLKKPIELQVGLMGYFKYPDTPIVHAHWKVTANDFTLPFGQVQNASFTGFFYNNVLPPDGHGDDNTQIVLDSLTGSYLTIPFKADSVRLFNLLHPLLNFNVQSSFPVEKLNNIFDNTFLFHTGNVNLDLAYHGGIAAQDTQGHSLFGKVHISNAGFVYLPHNIHFDKGDVNLVFNGNDLNIVNTSLTAGESDIAISGIAADFMNFYFQDPQKVNFVWNIYSTQLQLDEFTGLLSQNKKAGTKSRNIEVQKMNDRLQNLMQQSNMQLHLKVDKLRYKRFTAKNLQGDVGISQKKIYLQNGKVQFAGGSIAAAGSFSPDSDVILFSLKANVEDVEVGRLFNDFGNFGQNTITSKNIKGQFSSKIVMNGQLNGDASLVKNSLIGKVNFELDNGQLLNFAPLKSIQKFIFKNRNFDRISFKTIKNDLSFSEGKIKIPPMDIASNAIIMNVQGVYAVGKGTDIGIAIPLRNPERTLERKEKGLAPKKSKGVVVHLRARDANDGTVKIVWDPLKKAPQKSDYEDGK